jgi:hypothetical protein
MMKFSPFAYSPRREGKADSCHYPDLDLDKPYKQKGDHPVVPFLFLQINLNPNYPTHPQPGEQPKPDRPPSLYRLE